MLPSFQVSTTSPFEYDAFEVPLPSGITVAQSTEQLPANLHRSLQKLKRNNKGQQNRNKIVKELKEENKMLLAKKNELDRQRLILEKALNKPY